MEPNTSTTAGNVPRKAAAQPERRSAASSALLHDDIGVASVRTDGRILEVNPALCSMLGYSAEELQGKTFQEFTYPEDRPIGAELLRQMLAGERNWAWLEKRYVRKDGSVVWMLVSAMLIRDAGGSPSHFMSHVQDITEHKEWERKLRYAEERYRALFNGMADAAAVHELAGKEPGNFLEVNDTICERLGYTREELLQMGPPHINAPEMRGEIPERVSRLLADGHASWETVSVTRFEFKFVLQH